VDLKSLQPLRSCGYKISVSIDGQLFSCDNRSMASSATIGSEAPAGKLRTAKHSINDGRSSEAGHRQASCKDASAGLWSYALRICRQSLPASQTLHLQLRRFDDGGVRSYSDE
jgi:hypothetical protein